MLAVLLACTPDKGDPAQGGDEGGDEGGDDSDAPEPVDADDDGFLSDEDCDDDDEDVHPGADEVCDGRDNDCDGDADDEDEDREGGEKWYQDADGDGFGDEDESRRFCDDPGDGWSTDHSDCDDTEADVYPDADEVCDGLDNDCDGEVDPEDSLDATTWYRDWDDDGYGDATDSLVACDKPRIYVRNDGDCDDYDAEINPAADEVCDERDADEDCDGLADDADDRVTGGELVYRDADGDGAGSLTDTALVCGPTDGYIATTGDCDDADGEVHPAAAERCDTVDNDCDGVTDEDDAADADTWYADVDGDGYGDPDTTTAACSLPAGYSGDASDCDDTDAAVYPGAADTWYDGADSDCAGDSDADADLDGYDLDSAGGTDCDDGDADIHPGASETCDGVDQDCDGAVDDAAAADMPTWYRDVDKDGYGSARYTSSSCTQPSGYVANDEDCDDGDAAVYPGGVETWYDGVDGDCDEHSDYDADGDGWDSEGYDGLDCDDADASWYPGSGSWSVPGDFSTIQDAIDGACIYDTIEIAAGTYGETLDVGDKAVVLAGAGSGLTIIDAGGAGTVLTASGADGLELSGLTLTGGSATSMAGGLHGTSLGALVLQDVEVSDNTSTTGTGGIYLNLTTLDLQIDGLLVADNSTCTTASACRAGLHLLHGTGDGTASLNDLTFTGNTGNSTALYLSTVGGSVDIDGVLLEDNDLPNGYVAYVAGSDGAVLTVSNVVSTGNTSDEYAGFAVYVTDASASVTGLEATGNTSADGGILLLSGYSDASLTASDVEVADNTCTSCLTLNLHTRVSATLDDVRIQDNVDTEAYSTSTSGATGMYVYMYDTSPLDVSNLSIADNTSASLHGGLYLTSTGITSRMSPCSFTDTSFEGNVGDDAGAFYIKCPELSMDGVEVRDNEGDDYGAYINMDEGTLQGLTISGNTAPYALYNDVGTNDDVLLADVLVMDNSAIGLYLDSAVTSIGTWQLYNATVVGNGGSGLGYTTTYSYGTESFYNVISAYNGGYGFAGSSSAPKIRYSDVYGNTSGAYSGSSRTGSYGNLEVDPEFVGFSADGDPALWDLHLAPTSSLFDAGSTAISDADGTTSDMGYDAGAYDDYAWYTDADADGLFDGWESAHGLDTAADDSADDTDGDGLTNAEELDGGTSPASADTDGDGRSDYSELSAGTDALDANDP